MGGNAQALAGKAQMFLGGGLDAHSIHRHPKGGGQILPHGGDVGGQLGLLAEQGGIDVHDLPALLPHDACHMLRQLQAVGTGVGGVGIREVLADVAQRGSTQHSVHHSVGQHIGIRVAQQTLFKGHLHAAQDQLAVLDQTVNIITMTNAHIISFFLFGAGQILPRCDLQIGVIPLGQLHRAAGQFKHHRVRRKINDLGFIETPYRKVNDGVVDINNDHVLYLSAEEEEAKIIGQGNAPLDDEGHFIRTKVKCRQDADYPVVPPTQVDLMDVAPQQIASIAASLIPFLEHDDAHRALMGSNMMRQAVPLLRTESPIVGTGIEKQVCEDSRTMITAEGDGVIEYVDATTIRVLYDRTEDEEFVSFEPALKEYKIPKFRRTNQNMTIDLRPICDRGQRVKKGDILTEGYATADGELALGRNLLVAYMPWKGYNYEDAIVLNERVVREDLLTSVHVDEFSLEVRETKRGVEELTSDIPNVSEEATKDLDENGIIRVGARVAPGDILIGKITPKGESDPSPEEKLLRAIFGDKAGDVKDASLKATPSLSGVVIDKKLFSRAMKTRASKNADKLILPKIDAEFEDKANDLRAILIDKLLTLTDGKVSQGVKDFMGTVLIPVGSKFIAGALDNIDYTTVQLSNWTSDEHTNDMIRDLVINYLKMYKLLDAELKRKKFAITIGDELPSGIIQMAKVYIAKKRKIGVGDKMAGRHGNKGIVSKIVRQEDMPFLEDGTPVDIVLNPLGVPSRMNLGQIFEAVLGSAGKKLGLKFATPIFDGASLDDLCEWTDKAGLPRFGKTYLYNGETGLRFDQPATVGITYMLKLGHMVEDKMHARSIGPYSLITQQPLGGKAQFGGQRFGEMEVWALEAFGASHVLQEILTIKSDDVVGRSKAYEAIVKGDPMPTPGIPESLNVLLHELRGLGLSITLE